MNTTKIGTGTVTDFLFLDVDFHLDVLKPIMEAHRMNIDDINDLYRLATKFNKYSQDDINDIYNILLDEEDGLMRIRVEYAI